MRFKADDGSDFPQWEEKKLGDITSQLKRSLDPKTQPDQLFLEYSMPAFDENQTPHLSRGSEMASSRKILDKPCLLINKLNVRKQRIWLVLNPGENAVSSAEFVPLTSKQVDLAFLNYVASSNRFTSYLSDSSSGSSNSQKRVTPDIIEDFTASVPSLPEQNKIASLLSSVDETLYLCQRKLDLLTLAKKALMQQIFSRKLRFTADDGSDFPDWEEKKLGDLCHITTGSRDANAATSDGPYKFFTCAREDYLIDDYSFNGLAILVAGNGDVGHTKIYEGKFDAYQRTYVLMNFSENPYYLKSAIDCYLPKRVYEGLNMGAMPYIRLDTLAGLNIPLPSSVEQKKIAACLSSADALIAQARAELEQWQDVKKSLLQQMFV